jgi:hypothetical protein
MATSVSVAGSNLFAVAASTYGDFTAFWLLLQANGLQDPMLQGTNTITTPPWLPSLTGGVPPQQ